MAQALDPLEREILCMRFGLEGRDRRSFNEIAEVFAAPSERIRQLASRALRKLPRPTQQRTLAPFHPGEGGYTDDARRPAANPLLHR